MNWERKFKLSNIRRKEMRDNFIQFSEKKQQVIIGIFYKQFKIKWLQISKAIIKWCLNLLKWTNPNLLKKVKVFSSSDTKRIRYFSKLEFLMFLYQIWIKNLKI